MPFMENTNLTHHFLIAMPQVDDTFFEKSLVYVCEHSKQGALGIVVNRPMGITLKELFTQLDLPSASNKAHEPILLGGPVDSERGFILHTPKGQWQASVSITPNISMTTSRDLLMARAHDEGPKSMVVALGHAKWTAGQLEQEIGRNDWLHVPANADILFAYPPESRYQAAIQLLGFDFNLMPTALGHA